jgi:hypothetical protein
MRLTNPGTTAFYQVKMGWGGLKPQCLLPTVTQQQPEVIQRRPIPEGFAGEAGSQQDPDLGNIKNPSKLILHSQHQGSVHPRSRLDQRSGRKSPLSESIAVHCYYSVRSVSLSDVHKTAKQKPDCK